MKRSLALTVAALLVTGCSGVPSSSSPQVVRTIANRAAPSAAATITPAPNSEPRQIVSDFLQANLGEDAKHTAARAFLTSDARTKWNDTTVTIVSSLQVQLPPAAPADAENTAVSVVTTPVGSLDQRGVYRPALQGDGTNGTPQTSTFALQKVHGQWRIATNPPGLFVLQSDFQRFYQARKIYFLDASQRKVVPDLRYSALTGQTLCSWLLEQLLNGPLSELQPAVTSDLPAQIQRAQATYDGRDIVVDLPGISSSNAQTMQRLAAQLAFTLQIENTPMVSITDRSKPVSVPGMSSPFTASSFATYASDGVEAKLFYLRGGTLVDETGALVSGAVTGTRNLTAVAVAQGPSSTGLLVAGTIPVGGRTGESQLVTGSAAAGFKPVGVSGVLTRPTFSPGTGEAWVGAGSGLTRVTSEGRVTPVAVAGAAGGSGVIRAIAFSPDGVRLALVIAQADGSAAIWVGAVVRSGDDVRVDGLVQVTPPRLVLSDVAWNNPTTMYTIGRSGSTFGIWSVQSDGSSLSPRSTSNLPAAPDAIAAAPNVSPWVAAGQAIWVQRYNTWTPPGGQSETTYGTAPTYLQ